MAGCRRGTSPPAATRWRRRSDRRCRMSTEPTWHAAFQRRLQGATAPGPAEGSDGLELRPVAGVPSTVWENVSHAEMTAAISENANPASVAETAREWGHIGDDLLHDPQALARATGDSHRDWRRAR